MKITNLETRLDEALNRLAGGTSIVNAATNDVDVQELVTVAMRLQSLAPVPEPRLANGRRRFLAEASRHYDTNRWMGLLPRRAWTFALTLLALVVVSAVFLAAWSMIADRQNAPVFQATLTQTASPTYLPTPAGDVPLSPLAGAKRPQLPEPCPTPGTLAMLTTLFDEPPVFR